MFAVLFLSFSLFFPLLFNEQKTLSYFLLTFVTGAIILLRFLIISAFVVDRTSFFIMLSSTFLMMLSFFSADSHWNYSYSQELFRPIFYCLTFTFGMICVNDKVTFNRFFKIISALLTIVAILIICERFLHLQAVALYYTKIANISSHRFPGVFVNPYDAGVFLVLPLLYYSGFIFTKQRSVRSILINVLLLQVPFFALLITQSRAAFISMMFGLFVLLLLSIKFNQFTFSRLSYFVIFLILSFILLHYLFANDCFTYLFNGLKSFLHAKNHSFQNRLSQNHYIFSHTTWLSFLIGHGPDKSNIYLPNIENEYLLYFYRYGIAMFFMVIFIISSSSVMAYLGLRRIYRNTGEYFIPLAVCCTWFLLFFIVSISNPFIDIARNNQIYFFLFGMSYGFYKSSNSNIFYREKNI